MFSSTTKDYHKKYQYLHNGFLFKRNQVTRLKTHTYHSTDINMGDTVQNKGMTIKFTYCKGYAALDSLSHYYEILFC